MITIRGSNPSTFEKSGAKGVATEIVRDLEKWSKIKI